MSDTEYTRDFEVLQKVMTKIIEVMPHVSDPNFESSDWRQKVAHALLKHSLGKEKEKFEASSDPEAFVSGLIHSALNGLFPSLIFPEEIEVEVPEEAIARGQALFQALQERITTPSNKEELKNFDEGSKSAFTGFITPTGDLKRKTNRTEIYFSMLGFPEEFESCETVDEMYDELIFPAFPDFSYEAWKRLCSKVGLRGKKYEKHK